MKEHPRLQSRTQNICFVISTSAVSLKLMLKITSIFGLYRFSRRASHDIFSLSHHLLASWNLYIPRVAESKSKCSSSRKVYKFNAWTSQRLLKSNPSKTSSRAVENLLQRKLCVSSERCTLSPTGLPRVFIWVVRRAMNSGKKWRSALWLNAMHSGKKWWIH